MPKDKPSKINRREAFAATMGMAVAPLAIASASPEPVPASLPVSKPDFVVIKEYKHWEEIQHEHRKETLKLIEENLERKALAKQTRIDRAIQCMHLAGNFTLERATKLIPIIKDSLHRGQKRDESWGYAQIDFIRQFTMTRYTYHGDGDGLACKIDRGSFPAATTEAHSAWAAICVTCRTDQDGFDVLNVKDWWSGPWQPCPDHIGGVGAIPRDPLPPVPFHKGYGTNLDPAPYCVDENGKGYRLDSDGTRHYRINILPKETQNEQRDKS